VVLRIAAFFATLPGFKNTRFGARGCKETEKRFSMYTCRECEHEINQGTEICPHCGVDLTLPPAGEAVERKKLTTRQILLRWGALLTVLLGAMWSFLWFVAAPRTGRVALQAESRAVQAIDEVRALLTGYAAAQGGVYPGSLEPLGPLARQAAQMAQSEGYRLEYTPGPSSADGTIRGYSLEARAGNYGYRNFYTDVSGLVRWTSENRAATGLDPPIR